MMNEKLWLYLDDCRIPVNPKFILVKNYNEFVEKINFYGLEAFELISLDHDLDDTAIKEYFLNVKPNQIINYDNIKEKTGFHAAKFLVEKSMDENIPLPQIYTHSANNVGAENITRYINNYLKSCGLEQNCHHVHIKHTMSKVDW